MIFINGRIVFLNEKAEKVQRGLHQLFNPYSKNSSDAFSPLGSHPNNGFAPIQSPALPLHCGVYKHLKCEQVHYPRYVAGLRRLGKTVIDYSIRLGVKKFEGDQRYKLISPIPTLSFLSEQVGIDEV